MGNNEDALGALQTGAISPCHSGRKRVSVSFKASGEQYLILAQADLTPVAAGRALVIQRKFEGGYRNCCVIS